MCCRIPQARSENTNSQLPTVAFHHARLYALDTLARDSSVDGWANCTLLGFFYYRRLVQSRKRKLQELYSVSCHLGRAKPLPSFDAVSKWGTRDGAADEDERRFLEENDLEKYGHCLGPPVVACLVRGPPADVRTNTDR